MVKVEIGDYFIMRDCGMSYQIIDVENGRYIVRPLDESLPDFYMTLVDFQYLFDETDVLKTKKEWLAKKLKYG
jgi:hypothetical protein